MAPEQTGDPVNVDNRADIYSLGVVIYEMLTGELPGKNFQPPSSRAQIDARLDEVVMRAMEQDPDQRYQQASILKTEVENITESPPAVPPLPQHTPAENIVSPKVREDIALPATVMMIASGLALAGQLFGVLGIILIRLFPMHLVNELTGPFGFTHFSSRLGRIENLMFVTAGGWMVISTALYIVALIGANKMRRIESHGWAVASAVILIVLGTVSLGMISLSFAGLVSLAQLGSGIWAMIVLSREEVKTAFGNHAPAVKLEPTPAPVSSEVTKRKLLIPSIGLMVVAAFNLLFVGLMFVVILLRTTHHWAGVAWAPVLMVPLIAIPSIVILIGAWRMREMKSHTLAVVSAVLAIMTPPGLVIGMVFGIWALVVLWDRDVRGAFRTTGSSATNKGLLVAAGVVGSVVVSLFVVVLLLLRVQARHTGIQVAHQVTFNSSATSRPAPPVPQMPFVPEVWNSSGTAKDLMARYEACRMIRDFTVRDLALAGIAKDAAAEGNAAVAKQVLQEMMDFTVRDDARKVAAISLSDHGKRGDAVEIAKQINDFEKRDETLQELATRKTLLESLPAQ
jgi:hypothetical protein